VQYVHTKLDTPLLRYHTWITSKADVANMRTRGPPGRRVVRHTCPEQGVFAQWLPWWALRALRARCRPPFRELNLHSPTTKSSISISICTPTTQYLLRRLLFFFFSCNRGLLSVFFLQCLSRLLGESANRMLGSEPQCSASPAKLPIRENTL
jgi:hypothetical protein